VNWKQYLNGLQFHDQPVVNNKVYSVLTDLLPAISNSHELLSFKWDSLRRQFQNQCLFVDGLQKTRSERAVDFDASTDDPFRELVQFL